MNLLFDTNIIISIVRDKTGYEVYHYLNPELNNVYISFANVAEIQSIAFQNGWGRIKMNQLNTFIEEARVIDISDLLLNTYIGIDAYSQRNHPNYTNYPFKTSRNMGKNDLWIAATASLLNLSLVTTDADFDHLHDTFINLQRILPEEIQRILK